MFYAFLAAFLLIGMLAGFLSGLFGLGGGTIVVPALVLVFTIMEFDANLIMHLAVGTSLASMVITTLSSTIAHSRRGSVLWKTTLDMVPGIILGCMFGSFLANKFSGSLLEVVFGLFICILGASLLFRKKEEGRIIRPDRAVLTWVGLGVGTAASMLGVGGGPFMVPRLIAYGYKTREAVGSAAAAGLIISTLSTASHILYGMQKVGLDKSIGYVYWPAFGLIGMGALLVAPLGVKLAHRMSGKRLRYLLAGLLVMVGIVMVFH